MGGFSSQTQQPQTSGGGGKGNNVSSQSGDVINQVIRKGSPGYQSSPPPQPLDGVENGYAPRPMGKGGMQTNSATSGQPRIGAPNQYSNTVGQWDNTQIQPVQQTRSKGKGA